MLLTVHQPSQASLDPLDLFGSEQLLDDSPSRPELTNKLLETGNLLLHWVSVGPLLASVRYLYAKIGYTDILVTVSQHIAQFTDIIVSPSLKTVGPCNLETEHTLIEDAGRNPVTRLATIE